MVPDEVAGCKQQHMRPPRCVAPRPCRRTARHRSHLLCGVRQPPTVCDSRDGMRQPRRHATPTTGCDADDPCESRSASHPTRADAQRVQPSHLLHGVRQPPKACDSRDGVREPHRVAPRPCRRTARGTVTPAARSATATEGVRRPATGCGSRDDVRHRRQGARRRRCARAAVRRTPPAPTHSACNRHTCCTGCDSHRRRATARDGVRQPATVCAPTTVCESRSASHPTRADAQRVRPSHLLRGVRQPPKACDSRDGVRQPRRCATPTTRCDGRRRRARATPRRTPPAPTHSARDRHTCCAGCDSRDGVRQP